MFTIRKEQMDAFSIPVNEDFKKWVFVHLTEFFPDQCRAIGDPAVSDAIMHGITRAQSYGIRHQADVCTYIDLMFVFGRDFDIDRHLPWAASILNDSSIVDSKARIDRLYDEAMKCLRRIAAEEAAGH